MKSEEFLKDQLIEKLKEQNKLLTKFIYRYYNLFPEKDERDKATSDQVIELESDILSLISQIEQLQKGEKIINSKCADCGAIGGNETTHDCHKSFEPKSIFTRRRERNNKAFDFVVKHKVLIYQNTRHYGNFTAGKNDCQLQELITLARKEIGYSDRTWSGDIFTSLVNLYKKICV